ncbi:NAD synthetase / Glutamine amidotransferase chain of NAD synthetase [hydrothermal vent metagenome]|uniref:NAD(+) synthase (glutamine-hydrolyzing) n=1 Tax=hydrothermal vent metagenome TaxID=652676 RepID=A0A3B0QSG4_9ZZZZ
MAQVNSTVGAIGKNSKKILSFTERARQMDCDLAVFPELALTGYPPEDLLLKPRFISDNLKAIEDISRKVKGITALVGFVDRGRGGELFNSVAILHEGTIAGVYHKMFLPNYGVFDEQRYFDAGTTPMSFTLGGVKIGLGICEDLWYADGPARLQTLCGAHCIVNINASPFDSGKVLLREELLGQRVRENKVAIIYNNLVGGQDELVFDGKGMVIDETGKVLGRGKAFSEDLFVVDMDMAGVQKVRREDKKEREALLKVASESGSAHSVRLIRLAKEDKKSKVAIPKKARGVVVAGGEVLAEGTLAEDNYLKCELEDVLSALVLGTRDYAKKSGFKKCIIGLSGGIDSALVAVVAAKALGPENVVGVFMPSRYSSKDSREDAELMAKNLGIEYRSISITPTFNSYLKSLAGAFEGMEPGVAEENLQARTRGNLVMALSNKFGWLVLTTGNKSEMAVGYATLYGDMAGGFAVIKDVPKLLVFRLSEYINNKAGKSLIPERIITKPPSAELRPDQCDQDTLPPYEILDPILKAYVEDNHCVSEIVEMGFKKAVVKRIIEMVDRSEYKRRQSPPGIKITARAFGKDRRMPITNGYKHR